MSGSLVSTEVKNKAKTLRLTGVISCWLQFIAIFVAILSLIFVATGRRIADETHPSIGIGMFFAICGIIAAGVGIIFAFQYLKIGSALLNPNANTHPKKADTVKLLRIGLFIGLGGIFLTLIGAGFTTSLLVAKTISQPPGTTLTEASEAVRALDVFVMVANLNGIAAHFIAILTSLWLLYRV